MVCFLHLQLHETNMKTLVACHVKTWLVGSYYSFLHCYIQCWMEGSAEYGASSTLPSPPPVSVEYESRSVAGLFGNIAGMKDFFYLQQVIKLQLSGCPAGIAVAIPTELSEVPYMNIQGVLISP